MEGCHCRRPAVDSWSKAGCLEHGLERNIAMAPPPLRCSTCWCLHALLFESAPHLLTCADELWKVFVHVCVVPALHQESGGGRGGGEGGTESCTPAAPSKGGNQRSLNMKWISAPVKAFEVVFEFQEKKKAAASSTDFTPYISRNQRRTGRTLIKHVEETQSLLTVSVIITHSWSPHQRIDARTVYWGTFSQTGSWCFKQRD